MEKTRSLPDKFYDKDYENNGIHRVPLWRIGGFALNNTATNLYLCMMNLVAYYLTGWVGVGVVLAGSFATIMRVWDGVTDPFVGMMVDKTNGRFGKNRPFMVIGNVILAVMSFVMYHVTHLLPMAARLPFFFVMAAIYYLGYTCQCVVTKSAQSALTNDPKQRPLFAVFDAVYNTVMFTVFQMFSASLAGKYGGFQTDPALFHELWWKLALISACFTAIAVISIAPKDRSEFLGIQSKNPQKIGLKDYWDVIKNNRAIQMLVVSASTDKLASSAKTSAVTVVMFGVVAGNYALSGSLAGFTSIPGVILTVLCIGSLATMLGQRKGMIIGSVGGIITCALGGALWLFGDPTSMSGADGTLVFSFFTIAYIVLTVAQTALCNLSGNIVIPMTADVADYEVYRSGKYVPGLIGTLFSFVDKLISSAAPMIASLMFAAIGFKEKMPDVDTPYSPALRNVGVFLMYGIMILGLACNLVAMKFYPLTKEKMESIQDEIAAIKAKAMRGE